MTGAAKNPALDAARQAQFKVDNCLDERRSFRLEAGAGAGKTYSLVSALQRLISERGIALTQAGQQVACITYTLVARDAIAKAIANHPAILVETIHAFCWSIISQFQSSLRQLLSEDAEKAEKITQGGGLGKKPILYSLGYFVVDNSTVFLSHDDVPVMMAKLIENTKFQNLIRQKFPFIFIDEYQDTDPAFMASLTRHFLESARGPLIGLFGDHWQTIHRKDYELAALPILGIDKGSNFRSVPAIVNVLNELRPELRQAVSDPDAEGEARFFHVNSYKGEKTNTPHSKNDLPDDVARLVRHSLIQRLQKEGWEWDETKVLMLTHNAISAEHGYPTIADIYKGRTEKYVKKEDPAIEFLCNIVDPMCESYDRSHYGEMFSILGRSPAIRAHSDKALWRDHMDRLLKLRKEGTIGEIIDHLKDGHKPPLPERVRRREEELQKLGDEPIPEEMGSLSRYKNLRNVRYSEVSSLISFVNGFTPFATQHSVKGDQFKDVLVILGGGWNQYNWPQLFELLETKKITSTNSKGYLRSRNLFYVSVSRPMKRLAVLATQTLPPNALKTVTRLFGADCVEQIEVAIPDKRAS
ncbi:MULTISPECIES: UvrD-helicase domain-containing protein [unclassified Aureimonas]|uniref:UvrD-helicase domain-containing protein n=1 Tax=unclassified Aureimonas TaxID=2615206 RepID=UPI0009EA30D9|nr:MULTISPECIES: UvrD-helicase domain-containing protein [unclassified Aureimonas]